MAIFKDDWGVKRVEKELESMYKAEARKWRAWSFHEMMQVIAKSGSDWSVGIKEKLQQLERAKENWRLWSTDPEYQIAIADFITGMAEVNFKFGRKKND